MAKVFSRSRLLDGPTIGPHKQRATHCGLPFRLVTPKEQQTVVDVAKQQNSELPPPP